MPKQEPGFHEISLVYILLPWNLLRDVLKCHSPSTSGLEKTTWRKNRHFSQSGAIQVPLWHGLDPLPSRKRCFAESVRSFFVWTSCCWLFRLCLFYIFLAKTCTTVCFALSKRHLLERLISASRLSFRIWWFSGGNWHRFWGFLLIENSSSNWFFFKSMYFVMTSSCSSSVFSVYMGKICKPAALVSTLLSVSCMRLPDCGEDCSSLKRAHCLVAERKARTASFAGLKVNHKPSVFRQGETLHVQSASAFQTWLKFNQFQERSEMRFLPRFQCS